MTASSCSMLSKAEKSDRESNWRERRSCHACSVQKTALPITVPMTSASWNQCWAWGRTETSHVQAAVDAPNLSGDVPRGVRSQEVHHSGDLPRLGQPPHGDAAFDAI